jgi:hypothetical protein
VLTGLVCATHSVERTMEKAGPTLLMDEGDTFFNAEVRATDLTDIVRAAV